jgi:acyl-CoA synthetase (NDP forming)
MNLTPLFNPRSVALIGASNKEGTLGHDLVKMIAKGSYTGKIFPINPKYGQICGIRCYPDLAAAGRPVDLAVLCVNAKRVEEQARLCIDAGARALAVFALCELEEEAESESKLERRLIELCVSHNVPLLGHNAMGYYNNDIGLRVCGFEAPDEGVSGNISFISQSGSVFSTMGHNEPQLKFNFMVATGTGQVTGLEDYIHYALELPGTRVIGVYMESLRKPALFISALEKAAEKRIPLVLMKVGASQLGARFAQSHTGGLAGDDDAFQAAFDHYGVIRCASLAEMANTLLLFSKYPDLPPGGLVAIADSGGERNLLADVAEDLALPFARLSPDTMRALGDIQEYTQQADNPLDPWGTGIGFERIFEDSLVTMLSDENAAIGIISQDLRDGYSLSIGAAASLLNAAKRQAKPTAFMTNFSGVRRSEITARIDQGGSCVLFETRPALAAIGHRIRFRDFHFNERSVPSPSVTGAREALLKNGAVLSERDSLELLASMGINILPAITVNSIEELAARRAELTFPAVLKTAVPGILHKADAGGVKLKLGSYEELERAYTGMAARLGGAAVVVPMFSFDTELIMGMKTDPNFGPLVILGAGGIFTELIRDRAVLLPRASRREIKTALAGLKVHKLLSGFRGTPPADTELLVSQIERFCEIAVKLSGLVEEIDVNPLAVSGNQILALDALVICKKTDND